MHPLGQPSTFKKHLEAFWDPQTSGEELDHDHMRDMWESGGVLRTVHMKEWPFPPGALKYSM